MLHKIIILLSDLEHIITKDYKHPRRRKLLLDYLRIRLKASLNRWGHFQTEHFLDFKVSFSSYDIFFAIFRQIFVRHAYYLETTNQEPVILDCGGNIGMATLYFKYLYPKAKITIFEPSQEVFDLLEKNIKNNNLKNVEIVRAAVSDADGQAEIYPRGAAACGNTLEQNISKVTPTKKTVVPYSIKTTKLSSYINSNIDLLKLDIEGSEGSVIKDLSANNKLVLVKQCVMEYHYYPEVTSNNLVDLLRLFKERGWETQMYYEEVPHVAEQLGLSTNGSYSLSLRTAFTRL